MELQEPEFEPSRLISVLLYLEIKPTQLLSLGTEPGGGGTAIYGLWHGSHLANFFEEFVYLAVEIYHRGTLPSATPSFQVGKTFENRKIHQRCRCAWVG